MSKHIGLALTAAVAIAAAAGLGNGAGAQSLPPSPGVAPPMASHSDPNLPVPTMPPERMAPPARPHAYLPDRAEFRRLETKAWARFVPIVERKAPGSGGWASAAD